MKGGNVGLTAHNLVAVTVMAAVGLIVIKLLAGTQIGKLPVIGNVVGWLSKA